MLNESGPPSSNEHEADWDAISRFIAGESDSVEQHAVIAWLESHPADAALVAAIRSRSDAVDRRALVSVNTEAALGKVRAQLDLDAANFAGPLPLTRPQLTVTNGGVSRAETRSAREIAARPRPRRWPALLVAAAAAVAVIVVRQRGSVPEKSYTTKVGARDSIRLSDGSRVILAPGSTLTVAAGYGRGSRDVTVDGAAFFEVEHDGAHPFTVHVGQTEIRDIGTAFAVKTNAAGGVSVEVTHGVVAVRGGDAGSGATPTELRAGDRGDVSGSRIAVTRGTVTQDNVAWTHGQLAYRDAPMSEVQADVRRWYGIDLRFASDELAKRTLTTSFRSDSAADVIRLIALALGADTEQHGDTVILQMTGQSKTP